MRKFVGVCIGFMVAAVFLVPGTVCAADDNAKFVFAPAPITDPVGPGEDAGRMTLSFINIDTDPSFTLLGLNLTKRKGAGHGQPGGSFIGGLYVGGDEDDTTSIFGFNVGGNLEGGDRMSTPFFGFTIGMTTVTIDAPGFTSDTLMTTMGLQGGFQHHIELSPSVYLTPYVTYGWQMYSGFTDTTVDTPFGSSSSSTDFDGSTTTLTLGFDVSLGGISLATVASMGDEDMTMFQIGFNF